MGRYAHRYLLLKLLSTFIFIILYIKNNSVFYGYGLVTLFHIFTFKTSLNFLTSEELAGFKVHHIKSLANNLTVGFKSFIVGKKSLKTSYQARCSSL